MTQFKQTSSKILFLFGLIAIPSLLCMGYEFFIKGSSDFDHYHIVWIGFLLVSPGLFGLVSSKDNGAKSSLTFKLGVGWLLILASIGLFLAVWGRDHTIAIGYEILALAVASPLLLFLIKFHSWRVLRIFAFAATLLFVGTILRLYI